MSTLSAGSGTQFDSAKIWYFNDDVEGWTGNPINPSPTVVDGWIRPGDGSNPDLRSPASLGVEANTYRFVKTRIQRVGSPAWDGRLMWRYGGQTGFPTGQEMTLAEPSHAGTSIATNARDTISLGTEERRVRKKE